MPTDADAEVTLHAHRDYSVQCDSSRLLVRYRSGGHCHEVCSGTHWRGRINRPAVRWRWPWALPGATTARRRSVLLDDVESTWDRTRTNVVARPVPAATGPPRRHTTTTRDVLCIHIGFD